ncbi:MAG TPA: polysaccharide pyruvyl transferase CsaB [Sphingobacteriaceae bacterium]|nr:polysaccharide pyruvyl transferase CsaB [Sphingobacteriaceae bacterium]
MRRIVISGYYGFGNGGDEAMLAALVDGLRRLHPQTHLTVLSADPQATREEYGVHSVGRLSPTGIRAALKGADLLISGGGNLLQDVSGPFNIPYYLGLVEVARWHGAATMLLGQGIGPVEGRLGRWLIRRLADRVDAITVRDEESAGFLERLGVRRPRIAVAADTVFSLDMPAPAEPVAPDHPRPAVALSLRQRGLPPEARPLVVDALNRFTQMTGVHLLLVPMQPQEDLPLARWLAERLTPGTATLRPVDHWRQAAETFRGCEAVIAMRLHALIFAALVGRAPLGLSYDPKVDLFLAQVGLQPVAASDCLPEARVLARRLAAAYDDRQALAARVADALPVLRAKAAVNFEMVDWVLAGARKASGEADADIYNNVTASDAFRRQGRNG